MGGSGSKTVTTNHYVSQVRQVRSGMTDRDRRLYNFARIKIAEEDLDDAEITVDFQDQEPLVISATYKPSAKVHIGCNYFDYPKLVWQKRGFWRSIKKFFIDCFSTLKRVLLDALAIVAETLLLPITGPVGAVLAAITQ